MNKTIPRIVLVFLCLSFCPLFAKHQGSVEIRSAAFFPSSELFRKIYGNIGASYQLEISTMLNGSSIGWINFDWFSKHGTSVGFHDPTKVSIANISLGFKFLHPFSEQFIPYFGIGSSFGKIWLKNQSQCGHERVSTLAIGSVLKTGIYYFLHKQTFIDVFVDYLYQPAHFETNVNIGGLKTGVGLGLKF